MTTYVWSNGIGQGAGDNLVTNKPLHTVGNVWFVDSTFVGTSTGKSEQTPFVSIIDAVTFAASGDTIVLAANYSQTLTGALTIAKSLTIVGAGSAAGKPTAKLLNNSAGGNLLTITTNDVALRNIYFPENVQANTGVRISVGAGLHGFTMVGCYMECGANDSGGTNLVTSAAATSGRGLRLERCTFVSTTTDGTKIPYPGAAIIDQLGPAILDCIFDGGVYGFSDGSVAGRACIVSVSLGTANYPRIENLSLLRGADIFILGTVTGGFISGVTATGGAKVAW